MLLLFVLVPAVELALLIQLGVLIGTLPTLGIIALTGIVGAALARHQGLGVLRRIRAETAAGRIPAGPIVDGVIILLAGALLVTPGVLTDVLGFLCLIPGSRRLMKNLVWRWLHRAVREGRVRMNVHLDGLGGHSPPRPGGPFPAERDPGESPDADPPRSLPGSGPTP